MEKFSLAGSPHPMVGVVGQDVVLPCQLSPPARLRSMDVLWRKIGTVFITVHKYSDEGSQDLPGEGYQTRTELFLQEFSSGNVSLKLKGLQLADAGTYHCFVRNPAWSQEATTELRVAAVAPVFIDVLGHRGQGIGLACRSAGWFPKPELRWVGKNGQNLSMEIVTNVTQDREDLYSVVSHVTVTEEDNGDIGCIVWNGLLEPERQSAIHLSGDIFPRVSPWLAAFWVLFALVLIAAGACAYLGYAAKQKASQKKHSEEEALLNLDTVKKTLEAECQDLHEKLEVQKKAFESECQELHESLDARKKSYESDLKVQNEKIETEKSKNKALESECSKLLRTIEAQRKAFESDLKVQNEKIETEKSKNKALESECGKLHRTIETEKAKNTQLESELKVQIQKIELKVQCQNIELKVQRQNFETEENKKKQLESECNKLRLMIKTEMDKNTRLESECQDLREKFDKAVTQLDFMRAQSYMVPVTLDPDSNTPSSPSLRMAEESNMTLPP
ncbi:butyrophilin subfamily 3 member A2-like [Mauremys mutica]|uniref:butyrophilin subfamily 3 member A2-like n=1 Tax=Mauremys mutica TaxID=74926 RepID=UPI001D1642F0|nr:butyrophilin subfamily 3 member A2-like [Mauremys mutica]